MRPRSNNTRTKACTLVRVAASSTRRMEEGLSSTIYPLEKGEGFWDWNYTHSVEILPNLSVTVSLQVSSYVNHHQPKGSKVSSIVHSSGAEERDNIFKQILSLQTNPRDTISCGCLLLCRFYVVYFFSHFNSDYYIDLNPKLLQSPLLFSLFANPFIMTANGSPKDKFSGNG